MENREGKRMEETIQVVLIDRYQLFREGAKLILESDALFQVVAASDAYDILDETSRLFDIDIILMDVNILMENMEAMKEIIEHNESKVIVLADKGEGDFVTEAIKLGVHGFLFKEMDKISFVNAIKIVKAGDAYIHPNATHNLVEDYRKLIDEEINGKSEPEFKRPHHLYTKRECQILQLLTDGQSNRRISETLAISEKTVKNHVSSLFKKMQVNDRTQAVVMAIRNHWVEF